MRHRGEDRCLCMIRAGGSPYLFRCEDGIVFCAQYEHGCFHSCGTWQAEHHHIEEGAIGFVLDQPEIALNFFIGHVSREKSLACQSRCAYDRIELQGGIGFEEWERVASHY